LRGKINLLLVEDHRLMFEGLSSLLTEYPDINVMGVATTVADAVAKASLLKPDLVLMDYRLPDGDGAQASERIRATLPDTAVLFLSADPSESSIMRAVEAGASGYVSKAASAEELVSSIRKAAEGEFLLEAATMARLLEQRRQSQQKAVEYQRLNSELTPRERDVLLLLARGLDNFEIAEELGIGYGTVRGHVRGVLEKLGAHTRLQAVAEARKAGLVER
jgi:two-component system, NarL family, response regulator DevR